MSLDDWLANSWLVRHVTSHSEIASLLQVADRDLADATRAGLSADWRHNIAYNAALQLAKAALASAGYRSARERHHFRTIQSLAFTIELDAKSIRRLDKARQRRNLAEYDAAGAISAGEAMEIHELAKDLRRRVEKWLRESRAELL